MIGCLQSQGGQENGPCTCHLIQFKTWHIYQEWAGIMKFIQAVRGVNNLSPTAFVSAEAVPLIGWGTYSTKIYFQLPAIMAQAQAWLWQNLLLKATLLLKFVSIVRGLWSVKAA